MIVLITVWDETGSNESLHITATWDQMINLIHKKEYEASQKFEFGYEYKTTTIEPEYIGTCEIQTRPGYYTTAREFYYNSFDMTVFDDINIENDIYYYFYTHSSGDTRDLPFSQYLFNRIEDVSKIINTKDAEIKHEIDQNSGNIKFSHEHISVSFYTIIVETSSENKSAYKC